MALKNRTERFDRLLRRTAFTLMEMLVVVAIIVVLAGVGGAYLIGQLSNTKVDTAKAQARVISQQIKIYAVDHGGQFPESLEILLQTDENGKGPYFENSDAIRDPWGNMYQYDPSGQINAQHQALVVTPDVFTTTPDGRQVGNWK